MCGLLEGEPQILPHHLRSAGRFHQVQMLGLPEVTIYSNIASDLILHFRADLNKMMMSMSVGPYCDINQVDV